MVYEIFCLICSAAIPLLLGVSVFKLWHVYVCATADKKCGLPLPPGTVGLPYIGETGHFAIWGADFYRSRREKYGNLFKTHILGRPTIRVTGAKNIQKILRGDGILVTSQWPKSIRVLLGDGLTFSEGVVHQRRRKAVMKAFDHTSQALYITQVQELVKSSIQSWTERGTVLLQTEVKEMVLRIAADCLLGLDINAPDAKDWMEAYQTVTDNLFCLPIRIPGLGFDKALKARERLFAKMDELIDKELLASLDEDTTRPTRGRAFHSLVRTMSETSPGEGITKTELKFAVFEMLYLGLMATCSACTMVALQLFNNQKAMHKLESELQENDLMDTEEISMPVLRRLRYLNNTVKELLRVLPPVGGGYRKALQTFEIEGYQIPKDWTVIYAISDTHQTQELSPPAETFCPDRWDHLETAKGLNKSSCTYTPFGFGARSCIGCEFAQVVMKVFVIELLRGCIYTVHNPHTKLRLIPTPSTKDGMPTTFRLRRDVNNNKSRSCG